MKIRFQARLCIAVMLPLLSAYGQGATRIIDREMLSRRTHITWEGTYSLSDESVLRIEGLEDLRVLIYRLAGGEGALVEFAQATADGKVRILHEADASVKGVTPVFEGIDVLVGTNEAEIIVRWRHPGNGGLRSVDKYLYDGGNVRLLMRSHLGGTRQSGLRWTSDATANRSTPAELAPLRSSAGGAKDKAP
jgi:hypothetical protein